MPPLSTAAPQDVQAGRQVSNGLNLWLPLANPQRMPELLMGLAANTQAIRSALRNLHYVHFARFLPTPDGRALQVITSYDGDLDAYIMDFALTIGPQFEFIMSFVKDAPTKPLREAPAEFLNFIRANNLAYFGPDREHGLPIGSVYSAYPSKTVLDIAGYTPSFQPSPDPTPVAVDRQDVQANVLRDVKANVARHVGYRFAANAKANAFVKALVDGAGVLAVSDDGHWGDTGRPGKWLTAAFTYEGLQRLGISVADQAALQLSFPAFARGPDGADNDWKWAKLNGDYLPMDDASNPAFWRLGGGNPVHLIVSLYADEHSVLDSEAARLQQVAEAHGLVAVCVQDAAGLSGAADGDARRVHFGYEDGYAQPRLAIEGATAPSDDMQPKAPVGAFLLGSGYPNIYGGSNSLGGVSPTLGNNGCFGAFKILAQDVVGFEQLLDQASRDTGVDREWLAAQFMGRWRDGTPLSQSPDAPMSSAGAPGRNNFDYAPSYEYPTTFDDRQGARCPLSSHIRRMNPRSALAAGKPHSRRLMRRGMPYGPDLNLEAPLVDDGVERGLVGLFLCADLDRQFEFLLREWGNGDLSVADIRGQQDPIIGAQGQLSGGPMMSGQFRCTHPQSGEAVVVQFPKRMITTKGAAYVFLPGLSALRYLANLAP